MKYGENPPCSCVFSYPNVLTSSSTWKNAAQAEARAARAENEAREANIKAELVVQARTLKQRSWEEDFRGRAVTKMGMELSIGFSDYIVYVCTQLDRYIEKNQWGYNG